MQLNEWRKFLNWRLNEEEPRDNEDRDKEDEESDKEREKREKELKNTADKREKEEEKEDKEKEDEKEQKPNVNFKKQGKYYTKSFNQLKFLTLSGKDTPNDDEKNFIALAIETAEGREKNLKDIIKRGKAGNISGSDFSDNDITRIVKFAKDKELVR